MKLKHSTTLRYFFFFLFVSVFSIALNAQENNEGNASGTTTTTTTRTTTSTTDIDITSNGGDTWYTQPWVWIIGAAVFILLLIALLSGGRRDSVTSERITVKKSESDQY